MRTTLELDDELHETARRRAFEQRRSIGDVISELAKAGLAREAEATRAPRVLGQLTGSIRIAEDFDVTPAEVVAAIDEQLA